VYEACSRRHARTKAEPVGSEARMPDSEIRKPAC
jgi:hypothetical protein